MDRRTGWSVGNSDWDGRCFHEKAAGQGAAHEEQPRDDRQLEYTVPGKPTLSGSEEYAVTFSSTGIMLPNDMRLLVRRRLMVNRRLVTVTYYKDEDLNGVADSMVDYGTRVYNNDYHPYFEHEFMIAPIT